MSSRLMLVVNFLMQRKWLVVTDVLSRNLSPVLCRYREEKFHHYLHKNWDMTYSQCRLFHHSSLLYKRRKTREEKKAPREYTPPESKHKKKKVIEIWKNMTVKELATNMDLSVDDLLEVMDYVPNTEQYYKWNHIIDDFNVLQLIVKRLGHRWRLISPEKEEEKVVSKDVVRQPPPDPSVLVKRYPVVTIMGHVDHGKTTLLDTLRNSSIIEQEFGGITQHIGAFSVELKDNRKITFLDTPGHAAFSAMRSRGASVTDIVVLVVAADDGVMEQTDESIRMAREAQVPIIVAINKIDKPQADIERTKMMLLQRGIQLEDSVVGGEVQFVPISALKGTNVNALIEAILVQAEIMELKGDPKGLCEGVVIESKHDALRGKLATVLVQRGTLNKGKIIVAGLGWAKVRKMLDDNQKEVTAGAEPSTAIEVLGWREFPSAGDIVLEVESEKRAREVMDWREKQKMLEKIEQDKAAIEMKAKEHEKVYKAKLLARRKLGRFKLKPTGPREKEIKEDDEGPKVSVIIKGDVDGSIEAIIDLLATYQSSLCVLDVVHFDVGNITVSDVELAESFNAIIYAFNVSTLPDAKEAADEKDSPIRHHNVIYRLFQDLKDEINKQLPIAEVEEVIGEAEVLQQFTVTEKRKKIPVAGCKCTSGNLVKNGKFKVVRNMEVIYEGPLQSMKHLKEEVNTIKQDMECGLRLADSSIVIEHGDKIICVMVHKKQQVTDWDPGF